MPDTDSLLSLLNSAFDGWGDERFLRWKYDQYPGFDADQHAFYVEQNGELAAFRRVFGKELLTGGPRTPGFVLGDTTVAASYRGQGLYSQLHSTTVERCQENGAELVLTFNRTNNVTFEANRDRGWRYETLPLQMRILSPERVLSEYVDLVIGDWPRIERAIDSVGDRVTFVVDGEPVSASELVTSEESERSPAKRTLRVPIPASAVRRAVRAFGRQSKRETLTSLLGLSGNSQSSGKRNVGRSSEVESRNSEVEGRDSEIEITETTSLDDVERVRSLYRDARSDASVSFRREPEDIRHLCRYPNGRSILLAERGGDLCGFAVLGARRNGDVSECRVLDVVTADSIAFRQLIDEIERIAVERDHDVVLMLSHNDAGPKWVRIRKQVVMWDDLDANSEEELNANSEEELNADANGERLDGDWRAGLYDVV